MPAKKRRSPQVKPRPVHDWRTTDQDEIEKRRLRARAALARLPEPSEWSAVLQPPLSHAWAAELAPLRAFAKEAIPNHKPALECLERAAREIAAE